MVVHDLAMMCNLNVPEAKLEDFSKTGSTFLTKRFDRAGARRIHFASAMTLLGKKDGANATEGSSYLEIASIIKTNSASPQKDLLELWRRIVFNMAVSNTDDHLRNHGFVLVQDGWSLSPLYDVNPDIYGDALSLNVDSDNNLIDFNLALSVAKVYGLTDVKALEELKEIGYLTLGYTIIHGFMLKYQSRIKGKSESMNCCIAALCINYGRKRNIKSIFRI